MASNTPNLSSSIDLEIVGLHSSSSGRSCSLHAVCGEHVTPGDVLRLVRTTVNITGAVEEAIKCVLVVDGTDTCNVAFVPRVQGRTDKVKNHINKFVQVKELYVDSPNSYKRSKSQHNYGMASVSFLSEDIRRDE